MSFSFFFLQWHNICRSVAFTNIQGSNLQRVNGYKSPAIDTHTQTGYTFRVPTKIWKQNSMTFPWLICFFPWLPFSHGFRYGYDCISQHARQSQTRKLPQPQEQAIPWLFHDILLLSMTLGNFHIPRLFHDFPWQQFFPGFSMTVGILHITCISCTTAIVIHKNSA